MRIPLERIYRIKKEPTSGCVAVQLSFNKFRKTAAPLEEYDPRAEEEEDRDWDLFEKDEKSWPTIGKSGINRSKDNVITTKHDPEMAGRRNACKTGDGGGFDMSLNNKVFNSLRQRSIIAERRQFQRVHDKKEKQTNDVAMDISTKLLLYKLVTGGILDDVTGCVSTGKEAHVYHAVGGPGRQPAGTAEEEDSRPPRKEIPEDCAVKVFKTTMVEFKNRAQYIDEDNRFKGRMKALNNHKYINLWAEKEMHNLNSLVLCNILYHPCAGCEQMFDCTTPAQAVNRCLIVPPLRRLCKAGVPCPKVVSLKKHILVMSFIGSGRQPAPKLKEAQLNGPDLGLAYDQTVLAMVTMYRECRLVHADLSEYNLLWQDNTVFVIDLGQAVDLSHPHCLEFLYRDCTNVAQFFSRRGHSSALEPRLLFSHVTQLSFPGEEGVEFLSQPDWEVILRCRIDLSQTKY
ncbi:DSCR3 [Cordylochernes scorpioides]|uniref:Serine/threonine-protein kinase RIO3 n=1 Tax=Cordylochernes scorpioides TaxID=51811 RepID=A0ABY6KJT9_9ARAC|nr:DSCR3 [Cordylochernes scorpioides]